MSMDEYAQGPGLITMYSWQGLELEKQILSILYILNFFRIWKTKLQIEKNIKKIENLQNIGSYYHVYCQK